MRRKLAALAAVGLALALVPVAQAGVPGDPTPELSDRPDTLAVKEVRVLIKRAVRQEFTIDMDRRYSRDCDRDSRLRMTCKMRWIDDWGTWWKGEVEIWRTGSYGSPTDHYRVDADGDRNDADGSRYEGRFRTPVRRAYFDDPLTLPANLDETRVRVTVGRPQDGLPFDEFDEPAAGTRYVGFPVTGPGGVSVQPVRSPPEILRAESESNPGCIYAAAFAGCMNGLKPGSIPTGREGDFHEPGLLKIEARAERDCENAPSGS